MDYCLDAGDGTASIWTGHQDFDLDADGLLDGVRLDLDGDGMFDDVLADADGDGMADNAALDLDGDGVPEARYTDDGSGNWAVGSGAANRPLRWFDLDGVEHMEADASVDIDGDGVPERLLDVDRDGLADRALSDGEPSGIGYVDTDGDGRWDVTLADTDGDGAADGAGGL
jgi:hypothetical protein